MLRKLVTKVLAWDEQLKFALYAIRATPNHSTGFAPFEMIHGRVLRSPLDVVVQEIEAVHSRNVRAVEWLEELTRWVTTIREMAGRNLAKAQADRKERHDLDRSFQPGDRVLTRILGLHSKLDGSWEGPFTVLEVSSPFHMVLGSPGQKGSRAEGKRGHMRAHINACKPFLVTSVHRVAVWALEDDTLEVVTRLKGNKLTADGEARLMAVLDEWDSVLMDDCGCTDVLQHDINTAPSIQVYSLPSASQVERCG